MTTAFWSALWFWWLVAVAASFAVIELASILIRKAVCGTRLVDWTLSDCIRRWSAAHHQVPALVVGACALLLVHWFWMPTGSP